MVRAAFIGLVRSCPHRALETKAERLNFVVCRAVAFPIAFAGWIRAGGMFSRLGCGAVAAVTRFVKLGPLREDTDCPSCVKPQLHSQLRFRVC